ncbi:hypothetical protein SDC9_66108 [bioreactor metagenome]|uniref:Uncharacterized protein n=1 Tax=bioreactor metagenome TaxID=1076179 RepID=A0A644XU04_9ZZZZ
MAYLGQLGADGIDSGLFSAEEGGYHYPVHRVIYPVNEECRDDRHSYLQHLLRQTDVEKRGDEPGLIQPSEDEKFYNDRNKSAHDKAKQRIDENDQRYADGIADRGQKNACDHEDSALVLHAGGGGDDGVEPGKNGLEAHEKYPRPEDRRGKKGFREKPAEEHDKPSGQGRTCGDYHKRRGTDSFFELGRLFVEEDPEHGVVHSEDGERGGEGDDDVKQIGHAVHGGVRDKSRDDGQHEHRYYLAEDADEAVDEEVFDEKLCARSEDHSVLPPSGKYIQRFDHPLGIHSRHAIVQRQAQHAFGQSLGQGEVALT